MKKIETRKAVLLDALKIKKNMDIADVINLLKISEATARRLFTLLQNEGKIIRTHGGIQYTQDKISDYLFDDFENNQILEKESIGISAVSLISNNDIVFLEAGTTVLRLCYKLAEHIKQGDLNDITVFTNSNANLEVLHAVCKVILIGGEYRHKRRDFVGFVSEKVILNFRFNQCFLGADGVDLEEGFMTTDIDTAHIDALIISRSEKSTILLDSAKFLKRSLITFASFSDIDCIVTDKNVSNDIRESIESKNIELICE